MNELSHEGPTGHVASGLMQQGNKIIILCRVDLDYSLLNIQDQPKITDHR